jgi:hypothetical protein
MNIVIPGCAKREPGIQTHGTLLLDSGSGPSDHPGMTADYSNLLVIPTWLA